jgi:hypothetical protein
VLAEDNKIRQEIAKPEEEDSTTSVRTDDKSEATKNNRKGEEEDTKKNMENTKASAQQRIREGKYCTGCNKERQRENH